MTGVLFYVAQTKKTMWEGEPLVSGINCQPQSVYDDFLNTKLLYHKDGGTMFYHMVQSFPKGAAVDPRQAHEAARRLAEYFEGCEVLVCTHVDREHIHSHCVINSVNFETGKKLHMAKEQIQELMRCNDAICQEMGLPVFDAPTQQARGMGGAEYHAALKGQSWKLRLMNTIDECMKYAADKDAFVSLMASEGYAVRWESGRKYICVGRQRWKESRTDCPAFLSKFIAIGGDAMYGYSIASAQILVCTLYHFRRWGLNMAMGTPSCRKRPFTSRA